MPGFFVAACSGRSYATGPLEESSLAQGEIRVEISAFAHAFAHAVKCSGRALCMRRARAQNTTQKHTRLQKPKPPLAHASTRRVAHSGHGPVNLRFMHFTNSLSNQKLIKYFAISSAEHLISYGGISQNGYETMENTNSRPKDIH